MTAFSLLWISDKLSVFLENEKYSFYETAEKSDAESETETKLKTLFFNQIDFMNLASKSLPDPQNNISFYSFNVKEFCFENLSPPPEKA